MFNQPSLPLENFFSLCIPSYTHSWDIGAPYFLAFKPSPAYTPTGSLDMRCSSDLQHPGVTGDAEQHWAEVNSCAGRRKAGVKTLKDKYQSIPDTQTSESFIPTHQLQLNFDSGVIFHSIQQNRSFFFFFGCLFVRNAELCGCTGELLVDRAQGSRLIAPSMKHSTLHNSTLQSPRVECIKKKKKRMLQELTQQPF